MSLIGELFDVNQRELRHHLKAVQAINELEVEVGALDADGLRRRFHALRGRVQGGEEPRDLTIESFAISREAVRRALGIRLHDLQLAGALVVATEELAEMRGGEGKTVTALLPACLRALAGRGVHMLTANETQAQQDAARLGPVYRSLGLSVGVLLSGFDEAAIVDFDRRRAVAGDGLPATLSRTGRREAYECDVTYGTFAQFAGDYLLDQMVCQAEQQVQRGLAVAIVDDADHVLLEHGAAITLAVSCPTRESARFSTIAAVAARLRPGLDFHARDDSEISLLPAGREALTRALDNRNPEGRLSPADQADLTLALHAGTRVRPGRAGSAIPGALFVIDLDAAIPPSPALPEDSRWEVWGRIGVSSLLRLYESLGALAGSALSSAATLDAHYELDVVPVPRGEPLARDDQADSVFTTSEEKLEAVVAEALEMRARGRPVVIGTATRATRWRVEEKLRDRSLVGVPAGTGGGHDPSLVVVTGLAADVHPAELSADAQARGGLHVVGAEHGFWRFHDESLRDLAGRRGHPGSTHFFASSEDPTLQSRVRAIADDVARALTEGSDPGAVPGAVDELQQHREEARLWTARETQLRLEREDAQRECVYDHLDAIRDGEPRQLVGDLIRNVIEESVQRCRGRGGSGPMDWADQLVADLAEVFPLGDGAQIPDEHLGDEDPDLVDFLVGAALTALAAKETELGGGVAARERERRVLLRTWCRVLRDQLPDLDSIWSRLDAGRDVSPIIPYRGWVPLARFQPYPLLASQAFDARVAGLARAGIRALFRARQRGSPRVVRR